MTVKNHFEMTPESTHLKIDMRFGVVSLLSQTDTSGAGLTRGFTYLHVLDLIQVSLKLSIKKVSLIIRKQRNVSIAREKFAAKKRKV